jgi:RNA polymerase primary sigma factor
MPDYKGQTAKSHALSPILKRAALSGINAVIKSHISRGAEINATDANGRSALMLAAMAGHLEACKTLLEAGADACAVDSDGRDAKALAMLRGHPRIADLLAEHVQGECADVSAGGQVPNEQESVEELDLSGWEAEEEVVAPESDTGIEVQANSEQGRISAHVPIDLDEDWTDIEIDLPEIAEDRRRRRQISRELRGEIHDLLISALDVGGIHARQLEELSSADDKIEELAQHLFFIFKEAGVIIWDDNLGASLRPEDGLESSGWETDDIAREALALLSSLVSDSANSLTLYLKEIGRWELLTADDEIVLAREMISALEEAVRLVILHKPLATSLLEIVEKTLERGELSLSFLLSEVEPTPSDDEDDDIEPTVVDDLGEDVQDDNFTTRSRTNFEVLVRVREILSDPEGADSEASLYEILSNWSYKWQLLELVVQRGVDEQDEVQERTAALEMAVRHGLAARNRMAESNLKLVFSIVKRYSRSGMDLADLVQEGNIGLLRAVDKYDYLKGFRFSTYATWWIKQSVTRAIADKLRLIRLPVHMCELINKVERERDRLEACSFVPVTPERIATALDVSPFLVEKALAVPDEPLPLESFLGDETEGWSSPLTVADPTPEEVAVAASLREIIRHKLEELSPNQARIIDLRFGLTDNDSLTLEQVGDHFGVTRERVRQIEHMALVRLKHPSRSKDLLCYLR